MATTKNPLFSLDARGSLGGFISYSHHRRTPTVRLYRPIERSRTAHQSALSRLYGLCQDDGRTLSAELLTAFKAQAGTSPRTPLNQFFSAKMEWQLRPRAGEARASHARPGNPD